MKPYLIALILAAFTTGVQPLFAQASPEITWKHVVIEFNESDSEDAMYFISQLRPLTPGSIRPEEKNYSAETSDTQSKNLRISLSLYDTNRPSINYYAKHHELNVTWTPDTHRENTAKFMKVLQNFTQDGKLQPCAPEILESALTHEIVYREMNWQDVLVVCQDKDLGTRVVEALRPHVTGKIRQSAKAQKAGVVIRVSEHEGPTQGWLDYHRDNSLHLEITRTGGKQRIQDAIDRLLTALRPHMKEGRLRSIRDGGLFDSLRSAFRKETVEWHNIVIGCTTEAEASPLIEALRPLSDGKIRWSFLQKEHLASTKGLGNDYLFIRLISFHNSSPYMSVSGRVLPEISLNYAPSPYRRQPDETQQEYGARWDAAQQDIIRRFIRALQPLLKDGKLQPISVQELREHLKKY